MLLYGAPAVLLADGVLARTRRERAAYAVVMAGVLALAVPVQLLQQAVMAWEWTHAAGVPSRAWLQAIDVPGMPQEPYQWDARSRTLTAYFDIWIDPVYQWGDVETVTSDRGTPSAALTWAYGDGPDSAPISRLAAVSAAGVPGAGQCTSPEPGAPPGLGRSVCRIR